MEKCDKCGGNIGNVTHVVYNDYPLQGFPHDTKKFVCPKCRDKFYRYMSQKYKEFFKKESDSE